MRGIEKALGRKPIAPADDRAPSDLLTRDNAELTSQLRELLGREQVLADPLDIIRYSADASPYRMIPRVVVKPRSTEDVRAILSFARARGHSITFRAAGTSLNGQAQSDDILVDVREHFAALEVLDDGRRLHAGVGTITARANAVLARYGRKLGPDPASSGAATLGGVLANNASGMTCGTARNSYKTIDSLVVVLASGTVVDTAAPDADDVLAAAEPRLYAELQSIRDDLRADAALAERVAHKYRIKNTNGYRLDAFLDADRPIDILKLVMVGSEGTLGFIADSVWNTVPFGSKHTTAFFRFPTLSAAAASVPLFNAAGANAVEIIDAASLRGAKAVTGAPAWMADLGDDATDAVILTELRSADEADLDAFEKKCAPIVEGKIVSGEFTRDARLANGYWAVRSGLLATVGASRPAGTVLITEDVCVPPERLEQAVGDLQQLLVTHGFTGAVNGHASAGNLHFYLYLDSTSAEKVAAYRSFMTELVALICDTYDGSLKGEHGTGRNMAPFVEREWGAKANDLMWRIKFAFDPDGLLGKGVMMSTDPDSTYVHLKSMPVVDHDLDPCIECGFCEPVCPSRHVTTTPRQRIVLQREMARQGWEGKVEATLVDEYEYAAVNMCAGDSSCAIACPVDIDTGHAMKHLRRESWGSTGKAVGKAAADKWGAIEPVARFALKSASVAKHVVGNAGLKAITGAARAVAGKDIVPGWIPEMPGAARPLPATTRDGAEAVFFAACINRIFGPSNGAADKTTVSEAFVALANRAGHPVWIPEDIAGTCCATIWQSKGLDDGNRLMAARLVENLYRWSDQGRLPIVVDASSCTLGVTHEVLDHLDAEHLELHKALTIYDVMSYTRTFLVPDLPQHARQATAVAHVTCSMHTLGIGDDLVGLANEVADDVVVPLVDTCCGFAGDRGFLHPELTENATREQVDEVNAAGADVFLSGNRTCELGMEHGTGKPYESVIVALERLTRPA